MSGSPTLDRAGAGPGAAAVPRHPGLVLGCVCVCTVLVIGFVASINLAVPQLSASGLHPTASQLLWIVDAYVVLFACLVIPAGALGDLVGRKGVLMAGLVLFALGALISASAPGVTVLLAGRVVTGVGAAAILPNALAVLVHATEPVRRPRAIAVWAAMSGIGGVVGNVGGGAVLTAGSWRWLFVVVAPVALACAAWVAVVVPATRRTGGRLDIPGTLLLTLATSALLLGIIQGPDSGWGSPTVVVGFAAAALLGGLWVWCELRTPEPLLDPRLLLLPGLRAACLGMLVVFFGMFGFFYLNASLMQYGRGFTVLQAGLGVIPMTAPLVLGARYVPAAAHRLGVRATLGTAFVVIALGLAGLADALHRSYPVYAAWLVVVGIGVTVALPTLTIAITEALPAERAGVSGGLQATTRELGSAIGVATIGTLLTARFTHELSTVSNARHGHLPTVSAALAAAPGRHARVVDAYTASAATALHIVALTVLVAGALVLGEITWAHRAAATRRGRA